MIVRSHVYQLVRYQFIHCINRYSRNLPLHVPGTYVYFIKQVYSYFHCPVPPVLPVIRSQGRNTDTPLLNNGYTSLSDLSHAKARLLHAKEKFSRKQVLNLTHFRLRFAVYAVFYDLPVFLVNFSLMDFRFKVESDIQRLRPLTSLNNFNRSFILSLLVLHTDYERQKMGEVN